MRIFYAAGPGNVAGTYQHFLKGDHDPDQIAITYSGQFFEVRRALDAKATIVTLNKKPGHFEDENVTIDNWPTPWMKSRGGLKYHLGAIGYPLRLTYAVLKSRADVAVIGEQPYWFLLAPLALFGVKVIPTIHCVLWKTHQKMGLRERLAKPLNGWFFRHCIAAAMGVSEEIIRQVHSLSGPSLPAISFIPTYRRETFQWADADEPTFPVKEPRILFVGRIEANKGVFDLIQMAKDTQELGRSEIKFDVCGIGSALDSLKQAVADAGLADRFAFHGYLGQDQLAPMFRQSYAVVVPTTTEFVEGFNKVVAEGILSKKPVITSPVCPAVEYFGDGIVLVPPNDASAYSRAILKLVDDPEFYMKTVRAADEHRDQLYDENRGWGATLMKLLAIVFPNKEIKAYDQAVLSAAKS